jgi:hypothetical protein
LANVGNIFAVVARLVDGDFVVLYPGFDCDVRVFEGGVANTGCLPINDFKGIDVTF